MRLEGESELKTLSSFAGKDGQKVEFEDVDHGLSRYIKNGSVVSSTRTLEVVSGKSLAQRSSAGNRWALVQAGEHNCYQSQ